MKEKKWGFDDLKHGERNPDVKVWSQSNFHRDKRWDRADPSNLYQRGERHCDEERN